MLFLNHSMKDMTFLSVSKFLPPYLSQDLSPGAGFCGGVRMEALSRGHAVVTITVETEGCNISKTKTLVAYSPLKVCCSSVRACVRV